VPLTPICNSPSLGPRGHSLVGSVESLSRLLSFGSRSNGHRPEMAVSGPKEATEAVCNAPGGYPLGRGLESGSRNLKGRGRGIVSLFPVSSVSHPYP
jgi:hypothetical protein